VTEHVLAVDIGGTKMVAGLVDGDGVVLRSATTPTPAGPGEERVWRALLDLIHRLEPAGALACGVGCAGPMTGGGATVSPLNIAGWREFPLLPRLQNVLDVAVCVDGDAKALALGEGWRGAARGSRDYLALVVSTGIGGGLVVDGRLLDGHDGNAGHLGHVVVVPEGALCACGSHGCLEAEASGTALLRRTGRPAQYAEATEVVRSGRLLGLALASTVALLDLELVAVGGSVALGFGVPFFDACREEFTRSARIAHARGARIVPVGLGRDAPLIGAAAVAWRLLGRDVLASRGHTGATAGEVGGRGDRVS
jgi:glucokinase